MTMSLTYEGVERMRAAVRRLLAPQMLPGAVYMDDECGPDWNPSPMYIETVLHTYIAAGVTPQMLENMADLREQEWAATVRKYQQRKQ